MRRGRRRSTTTITTDHDQRPTGDHDRKLLWSSSSAHSVGRGRVPAAAIGNTRLGSELAWGLSSGQNGDIKLVIDSIGYCFAQFMRG